MKKQNADTSATTYHYDGYGRVTEIDYPGNAYGADGGSPLVAAYTEYLGYDTLYTDEETDCATGSNVAWPMNGYAEGRLTLVGVDGSYYTWLAYDVAGRIAQRVELRAGMSVGNTISSRNVALVDSQGNPLRITGATPADEQDFSYLVSDPRRVHPDEGPKESATDGGCRNW